MFVNVLFQVAAANAKKMCGMVEVFTDDNKNMTVNNTMSSGTQVPQEVPYEKGKKFTDLKDMFPCFYVLGGSNGAVMLVGSHEHQTLDFTCHKIEQHDSTIVMMRDAVSHALFFVLHVVEGRRLL